jgi:alcohol dehydrogenase (cytochrome c)
MEPPSLPRPERARPRRLLLAAAAAAVAATAVSCGTGGPPPADDWPLPNLDHASTRSLPGSGIDRASVRRLRLLWRFRFPSRPGPAGAFTATPVVAGGRVFVQDMQSNVFALDLETGAVRWRRTFAAESPGPNGLAVVGARVYGATDAAAFALSAATGRRLWRRPLVTARERYVDVAPQVANGVVYLSTVGVPPDGQGALYALDGATGRVRWRLSTIKDPWRVPAEAGGGGAWYPPSVSGDEVFWGTANPYPYGGTRRHPNGGAFAGAALYTDSLLVVDAATGRLRWYDQVTRHDVRDHDFQLSPVLGSIDGKAAVFGAGKAGVVIAWDRGTRQRIWQTEVGLHRNDAGPLPRKRVPVCPGLLGGVETPMALAGGTLFVPVVDLCSAGSAYGYESLARVDPSRGRGRLVALDAATGARIWERRLAQPVFGCATAADGVVFTSTFDGTVYGLDASSGATLWNHRMPAGVNSCPALSGDLLLVGAGVPGAGRTLELDAFSVRASR